MARSGRLNRRSGFSQISDSREHALGKPPLPAGQTKTAGSKSGRLS